MKLSSDQQKSFNDKSTSKLPKTEVSQPAGAVTSSNLPSNFLITTPLPFGGYAGGLYTFPNDGVQLDIYNDQDYYYESITAATEYTIDGTNVIIDLEKELVKAGYESGDFRVRTRLLRNYLGSASTLKVLAQEISADRLEVRVIPAQLIGDGTAEGNSSAEGTNAAFFQFFGEDFFSLDKQAILSSLYVFTNNTTSIEVTDYIQDRYTIQSYPYSIIFKLQQALPLSVVVGTSLWISQEVNPPVTENVIVYPTKKATQFTEIKGPNFDVLRKKTLSTDTEYQSWDEILSSNTRQLTQTVFSQSLVEGIDLNVDYRKFENFIKFGSAYERIKNFEYKIKLIENYKGVSASLATSTASESFYVQTQMTTTLNKIDNIVGAFDGYEKYMYFESSSYVSNSFGEFLDMAWPKSTSTKPYVLYGSSTTQVDNWLSGLLSSASFYDNNNSYSLRRLVPEHIQQQESQVVDSFISMLGHFFDVQYEYINQIPKVYDRQESLTEGFAKELVYHVAQGLGVDFSNGDNFKDLWSYTLGLDASGSYDNILQLSGEDRTRETWKRIINNLPYLLKTKGTERGIRALINCYGIPSTILRIREYGGPEVDLNKQSTYDHDRFYYALNVGAGNTTTQPQHFTATWTGSNGSTPAGFELRFIAQPFSGSVNKYNLLAWYNVAQGQVAALNVGRDNGGDYVEYVAGTNTTASASSQKLYIPSSSNSTALFDGTWTNLYVSRTGSQVYDEVGEAYIPTGSYAMFVGKKANYSNTPLIYSSSWVYSGSISPDAYWWFNYPQRVVIGSSSKGGFASTTASFSGSVQELRFWGTTNGTDGLTTGSALCEVLGNNLQSSPFYAHTISPTTIVGPNYEDRSWTGATSSYVDLAFRLPLGTNNVKTNLNATSSLSGSQPNYNYTQRQAIFSNYSTNTSSYWTPIVEANHMPWPDISGNRSISNKVRLEQTFNTSQELYRNKKTQLSLQDDQPVDSPRLGIYLSPIDEINKDIAEQFAGLSLDDYIGNYNEVYSNTYEDLADVRQEYLKKNVVPHKTQNYIRLLQHFNGSLFSVIKQMVPYRANLQTGLVIEPHLLDRSKVKMVNRPVAEDEYLETLIDMPSTIEPTADVSNLTGSIETPESVIIGEDVEIPEGVIGGTSTISISAKQNEYNRLQVPSQGRRLMRLNSTASYEDVVFSGSFTLEDSIYTNVTSYGRDKTQGSQYIFPSWYLTGSISYSGITTNTAGFAYLNSVGDDYSNPIGLTTLDTRGSEAYTYVMADGVSYNGADIYKGTGSLLLGNSIPFLLSSSYINNANADTTGTIKKLGLRVATTSGSTGTQDYTAFHRFRINDVVAPELRLQYFVNNGYRATGSIWLNAFSISELDNQAPDYYDVSFDAQATTNTPTTMSVWYGTSGSNSEPDFTASFSSATPASYAQRVFAPVNSYLYIELRTTAASSAGPSLDNFVVKAYKVAQIQDYQVGPLASIGQRNQKYDGCKMTSTDWNVDSSDTIDGGPVITITEGPGVDIVVDPNNEGTFIFR